MMESENLQEVYYMEKSIRSSNRFGLFLLIIFFMGSMILSPVLLALQVSDTLMTFIVYTVLMFIPCLIYARMKYIKEGVSFAETFNIRKLSIPSILLVIGFGLTIQPLMGFISTLSSFFFTNTLNDQLTLLIDKPLPLLLLSLAVFPAFFEEIPTRGVILAGYKDVDIRVAALVNGLFFGFLHLNFQQFTYAFLLGALFVYLVKATGSIFSSMLAHFIINGTQAVTLKWSYAMYGQEFIESSMNASQSELLAGLIQVSISALIFTPVAYLCLRTLFKINGKSHLLRFKQEISHMSLFKSKAMTMFYVSVVFFVIFGILLEVTSRMVL